MLTKDKHWCQFSWFFFISNKAQSDDFQTKQGTIVNDSNDSTVFFKVQWSPLTSTVFNRQGKENVDKGKDKSG